MASINYKKLLIKTGISLLIILLYLEIIPMILSNLNLTNTIIDLFLKYTLLLIITLSFFYKDIINEFKEYKNNWRKIILNNVKYYIIGLLFMLIFSSIISIIMPNGMPENEVLNRNFFSKAPILFIYSAVIVAPICEELVFRYNFKYINNKWLFIIGTAVLFALPHVFTGIEKATDLLYFFPYFSLGVAFGYIYKNSKTIFGSITFHLLHNLITILLLVL